MSTLCTQKPEIRASLMGQLAHMQTFPTFMSTKWPFGKGFFLSIARKIKKKKHSSDHEFIKRGWHGMQ